MRRLLRVCALARWRYGVLGEGYPLSECVAEYAYSARHMRHEIAELLQQLITAAVGWK